MPNDCIICLDSLEKGEIADLKCKHEFHNKCISEWICKENSCPICRRNNPMRKSPLYSIIIHHVPNELPTDTQVTDKLRVVKYIFFSLVVFSYIYNLIGIFWMYRWITYV
jgi:plasmid rolling circle replication initiator protein Rep